MQSIQHATTTMKRNQGEFWLYFVHINFRLMERVQLFIFGDYLTGRFRDRSTWNSEMILAAFLEP